MTRSADARTVGWERSCGCTTEDRVPAVVLDPFSGAGTVALAALRLGRDAIGIDLDPRCAELAQQRIACVRPRVWHM